MHILVVDQPPMNLKRAQMIIDAETETSLSLFEPISHLPAKILPDGSKTRFRHAPLSTFRNYWAQALNLQPNCACYIYASSTTPETRSIVPWVPWAHRRGQIPIVRPAGSLHFDLDWSSIHQARKLSACLIEHNNLLVAHCRKLITQNGTNATKLRLLHKSSPSFSKIP